MYRDVTVEISTMCLNTDCNRQGHHVRHCEEGRYVDILRKVSKPSFRRTGILPYSSNSYKGQWDGGYLGPYTGLSYLNELIFHHEST